MKTTNHDMSESRMATGVKFAALAALLGLIAVMTQPGPGMLMSSTVVSDVPTTMASGAAAAEYFPAHFPAPAVAVELPAQF